MASENETLKSPLYGEVGGRSKSRKNKGPKKPPQRGLGVEQLERMRAQEAFKKMAEASGVFHIDHHNQQQQQQQQVLLRYGALSSNVPFQFPQQQMMINENNNNSTNVGASAFGPYKNGFGVGTCSNVASGWFLPNNQHNIKAINHFGSGSSLLRNPLEPSKDLSSMQNLNSQCFDLCLKKTRMNEEENVMRDSIWSNHVHDFHNKLLFKHDESVEVVAVHRRGNSSSGNSRVFMEYEFFPRKDERGTVFKEQEFPTIDFGFGEASSSSSITVNTTTYGGDSSNAYDSIDLSLKL